MELLLCMLNILPTHHVEHPMNTSCYTFHFTRPFPSGPVDIFLQSVLTITNVILFFNGRIWGCLGTFVQTLRHNPNPTSPSQSQPQHTPQHIPHHIPQPQNHNTEIDRERKDKVGSGKVNQCRGIGWSRVDDIATWSVKEGEGGRVLPSYLRRCISLVVPHLAWLPPGSRESTTRVEGWREMRREEEG